mgnify:CR=1 FL=1
MAIKIKVKEYKHKRCIEDHLQQVLSAAVTYEGRLADYQKDSRVYAHKLTDSLYDLFIKNLQVFARRENDLGASFKEHQTTLEMLIKTKYPEFTDGSWQYTGGFFYGKKPK